MRRHLSRRQRHRTKWSLALEMIDELGTREQRPPVIVADAGYGEITTFRPGLKDRRIPYVLAVKATTSAHPVTATPTPPETAGAGHPFQTRYREKPPSLRDLAIAAGRTQLHQVTRRRGTRTRPTNKNAAMRSRFLALRVRPANRDIPLNDDGSLPEQWLLAEWRIGEKEPTDYWISDLPEDTPIATLVRIAKMRWRIEHDYRELKAGLGLAHFEDRTFAGWHRHATLVTAAHLFLTRLRLTHPKAAGAA